MKKILKKEKRTKNENKNKNRRLQKKLLIFIICSFIKFK